MARGVHTLLSISPEGVSGRRPLQLSRGILYRIEFPEPVALRDLGESIGRAMLVSKERGIKGRQPAVQWRNDRPGIIQESSVWYLLKCGQRYIDVLAGVLAGEGYLVKIDEMPNPWDEKEPALPEDRLPVRSGTDG